MQVRQGGLCRVSARQDPHLRLRHSEAHSISGSRGEVSGFNVLPPRPVVEEVDECLDPCFRPSPLLGKPLPGMFLLKFPPSSSSDNHALLSHHQNRHSLGWLCTPVPSPLSVPPALGPVVIAAPFIPASGGTGPVPAGRSLGTGGGCLPAKVNSKPPSNRNLRSHWEGRGTELSHPLSFHLCPEGGGFSSQLSPTPGRST